MYKQKYGTSVDEEDLEKHVEVQDGAQGIHVVGVAAKAPSAALVAPVACSITSALVGTWS